MNGKPIAAFLERLATLPTEEAMALFFRWAETAPDAEILYGWLYLNGELKKMEEGVDSPEE